MNEGLKNKFKNGMIPDEVAFGQLIDEATKEVDLSDYATKEEIPVVPDVSNFITLEDIPETDLSEYAKVSDIPSLDGLLNQTAAETLYVRKDALPNFEEYAKKTDIPAPQDLSHLATKSEIPDVSSFITLEDIPPTDLSEYAKVADIPSLEGLLSENTAAELYVRKDNLDTILADYAKKTEIPTTDHLATKEEIPDVSGFITLDEVPKIDLSEHAKKTELKSLQEYTNKELSALNKGTKGIYSNKNTNSYLVVQDDDISIRLYTEIYPWAKQKGIPIVAALVTNFIDTDGYISYEQFVEMKESGVVEFVNHTQNHLRLADLTPEEIHYEIGECEKFLMNEGIHTKHLVYPYGSISDTVKEISSHYVNSATKSNQRIIDNSKSLLDRFQINRIVLEHGVNNFNNRITEAINKNGSIIINVHAHYESFDINNLDTIVTNAENAGMKVVDYTTLFEKIENPIDIKRNNSTVLGISSEGYIEGIGETITRLDQVNFSLTPEAHLDEYPIGSLVAEITTAKSRELGWQMQGEQAAAVLETYNNHYDYAYQILHPIRSTGVYKRSWISSGSGRWGDWYKISGTVVETIPATPTTP